MATPTPAAPSAATSSKPSPASPSSPAGKKSGGGFSLFSCFSCGSSSAFDDAGDKKKAAAAVDEKAAASSKPKKLAKPVAGAVAGAAAGLGATQGAGSATTTASDEKAAAAAETETGSTAAETGKDDELAKAALVANAGHHSKGAQLSAEETEGVTSGAVMAPGATSDAGETPKKKRKSKKAAKGSDAIIMSVPEPGYGPAGGVLAAGAGAQHDSSDETDSEEEEEDEEQSLIARGGVGIPIGEDGLPRPLLAELTPEMKGKKCLVLDLDETLVHSSFRQMIQQADYVVPVEIENQFHNVYVIKRPGVDHFLTEMGKIYEIVVFTASLSKYADPVLDQLDVGRVVKHRLFRESCYNNKGNYVKDLSQLGRTMESCIIIDNSPASYVFHVNNAVPISSWFNDNHDTELSDLVPFLTDLAQVDDIRSVLDGGL